EHTNRIDGRVLEMVRRMRRLRRASISCAAVCALNLQPAIAGPSPTSTRDVPRGRIEGVVADAVARLPLPFAPVVVQGAPRRGLSQSDGRFSIDGLAVGHYILRANLVGYTSQTIDVQVLGARRVLAAFVLSRAAGAVPNRVEANTQGPFGCHCGDQWVPVQL